MQDHGVVYFMLFTFWAVLGLANELYTFVVTYLATIIAIVVKGNSHTPSPCISISISIADHITDIRIIRIRIRIIQNVR